MFMAEKLIITEEVKKQSNMAFKMRSGNKVSFKNMGSSPAKDMKTGSYEHSFESPAKQKLNKGGEGQDQDKIFNSKGEHIGDYVNDKPVMKPGFKRPVVKKDAPVKPTDEDMYKYSDLEKYDDDRPVSPNKQVKPKDGDYEKYSDLEKYDDDNPTGKAKPPKKKKSPAKQYAKKTGPRANPKGSWKFEKGEEPKYEGRAWTEKEIMESNEAIKTRNKKIDIDKTVDKAFNVKGKMYPPRQLESKIKKKSPAKQAKQKGLGPKTAFGGVKNPELEKRKKVKQKKVMKDGPKNKAIYHDGRENKDPHWQAHQFRSPNKK